MSRRARITLHPPPEVDVEVEPAQAADTAPEAQTEMHARQTGPRADNEFATDRAHTTAPATAATRGPSIGTVVKMVIAGLVIASVVLVLKNRRF